MEAQARGNQDLEIMKALGKPKKPDEERPNIDAMVGYNVMTDRLKQVGLNG